MRAAAYARYSTDKQSETSIEDQFRNCDQRAEREGWIVMARYSDKAMTGSTTERPEYQRMMADARSHKFDVLLVDDLSRLSRDQIETEQARRRFVHWGIRLIGVCDGIDTNSKGHKVLSGIKGIMNELFLDDLRDKVHRGLKGKALHGFHCGGRSYGYKLVPVYHESKTDQYGNPAIIATRLEIHPEEAKWVLHIFDWYAEGRSSRWIAAKLNELRVSSPRHKTWAMSCLYGDHKKGTGLLNNPLYIGRYIWNRFLWLKHPETQKRIYRSKPQTEWITKELPELRIVPQELWDRVKKRQSEAFAKGESVRKSLGSNIRRQGGQDKYLLSGLLKCGLCGAKFVIVSPDRYGCASFVNRGLAVCGNRIRVSRQLTETLLLAGIKHELFTRDAFDLFLKETSRLLTEQANANRTDRSQISGRKAAVEKELANLVSAIKAGIITQTTKDELEKLEAEHSRLKNRLNAEPERTNKIVGILPGAWERYKALVVGLEHVPIDRIATVRPHLKALLGGSITLHPTAKGYLEAEMQGSYEGLVQLAVGEGKMGVVAGEGFEPSTFGL